MKLLVISCSTSSFSRSRLLADQAVKVLHDAKEDVEFFDVRGLPSEWANSRALGDYPSDYSSLYAKIAAADGVVFCFPVYNYTASSSAKAITEILGDAFEGKPVCMLAASGSLRSHLAVHDLMRNLMLEVDALCFPRFVLATKDEVPDHGSLPEELLGRVQEVTTEFVKFVTGANLYLALKRPVSQTQSAEIFIELFTSDIQREIQMFTSTIGMRVVRDEGDFCELRHGGYTLLLNTDVPTEPKHPFAIAKTSGVFGGGCEIGIVVSDVNAVFESFRSKFQDRIVSGLNRQSWGMTDFRIQSNDGYYIRITGPRET
jgi:NAD(P)H-dependent FMN reductase/catechol 2,3-dioxygenase-like lactoylglutathione lyase family enzyme